MAEDSTIYQPLPGGCSTRVLHIEPDAFNAEIRCRLETIFLDDEPTPTYEALSYVWGPPEPRHWIKVDGVPKSVTENLAQAIRQLPNEDCAKRMWIDALCVNQSDLDERAQQVQLMRDIYSRASTTFLWLGEEDQNTSGAMAILRTAAVLADNEFEVDEGWTTYIKMSVLSNLVDFDPEEYIRVGLPKSSHSSWQGLFSILQRPWFNRVRIIQEAVLSKNAIVLVGKEWIPWNRLYNACLFFLFHGRDRYVPLEFMRGLISINLCRPVGGPDSVALPHLLRCGKTFQATDVRDKIHALVGLIRRIPGDDLCSLLAPNYRDPPIVVFTNVVKHLLECTHTETMRNLEILTEVFHLRRIPLSPAFPSWVPRWDLIYQIVRIYARGIYRACGSRLVSLKEPISRSTMILKGIRISNVGHVDAALGDLLYQENRTRNEVWKTVKLLWISFTQKALVHQGQELTRAFAKVITAGGIISGAFTRSSEADFTMYFMEELERENNRAPSNPGETISGIPDPKANFPMPECDPILLAEGKAVHIRNEVVRRPIFTTMTGHLGTGDDIVQPGDLVCVLFGGETPFILRKVEDHYTLIGECYVHGTMHGEAIEKLEAGEAEEEWFELH